MIGFDICREAATTQAQARPGGRTRMPELIWTSASRSPP